MIELLAIIVGTFVCAWIVSWAISYEPSESRMGEKRVYSNAYLKARADKNFVRVMGWSKEQFEEWEISKNE